MKSIIKLINTTSQISINAAYDDLRKTKGNKFPNAETYEEFLFRVNSKTKITYDTVVKKEELGKLQPDAKQLLYMLYSKFVIETTTTYSAEIDRILLEKRGDNIGAKFTLIAMLVREKYGENSSVFVFMHDFIAANKITINKYPTLLAAKSDAFDMEISKALLSCSNEYTNICKEFINMFFRSLGKNLATYFWENSKGHKTISVEHLRGIFATYDFDSFFGGEI